MWEPDGPHNVPCISWSAVSFSGLERNTRGPWDRRVLNDCGHLFFSLPLTDWAVSRPFTWALCSCSTGSAEVPDGRLSISGPPAPRFPCPWVSSS